MDVKRQLDTLLQMASGIQIDFSENGKCWIRYLYFFFVFWMIDFVPGSGVHQKEVKDLMKQSLEVPSNYWLNIQNISESNLSVHLD